MEQRTMSVGALHHFKVSHPNLSNDIPQMRSGGFQPPFIAGGNQVAYYLGIKGNTNTQPEPQSVGSASATKRIIKIVGQK